tara:strand:+ start:399 stop:1808 length:1410 start_codon:yes stop_codon:yes gene_type:complete
MDQRDEMQRRYEEQQQQARMRLGLEMAVKSGDPNAIAAAGQAAVEGGILPATEGYGMPDMVPLDTPQGEAPHAEGYDRYGMPVAPNPYEGLDPTVQGLARGAARDRLMGEQAKSWEVEQQQMARENHTRQKLGSQGWKEGKNNLFYRTNENGTLEFRKLDKGMAVEPKVHSVTKNGITIFEDGSTTAEQGSALQTSLENFYAGQQSDRIALQEARLKGQKDLFKYKSDYRVPREEQEALVTAYNNTLKEFDDDTSMSIEVAVARMATRLKDNPNAQPFIDQARVSMALQQADRHKIDLSSLGEKSKGELAGLRTQQKLSDELFGMLSDPEVTASLGPFSGRWHEAIAGATGNSTLTEKQKAFLVKLGTFRDVIQRDRTGAAISEFEKGFYEQLLGTSSMTPASLKASLKAMYEYGTMHQMSIYETGFPGASKKDIDWIKSQILYQPQSIGGTSRKKEGIGKMMQSKRDD